MARPQARQRYNAKARQSTLGGSSHKKRRKTKVNDSGEHDGEESEFEGIAEENEDVEAVPEDDQERKKQLKLEVSTGFCMTVVRYHIFSPSL
jgi:hypothetical protein